MKIPGQIAEQSKALDSLESDLSLKIEHLERRNQEEKNLTKEIADNFEKLELGLGSLSEDGQVKQQHFRQNSIKSFISAQNQILNEVKEKRVGSLLEKSQ